MGVGALSIFYFIQRSNNKLRKSLVFGWIICIICIILTLILLISLSLHLFWYAFVPACCFGITFCIVLLKQEIYNKQNRLLVSSAILYGVAFLLTSPLLISYTLRYIYTPPALTAQNIPVYKECIEYISEQNDCKELRHIPYIFGLGVLIESPSEKNMLAKSLYSVRCVRARREKDMILFYKDWNLIVPTGPGVLYSMTGENPNEIDSKVLNETKPFIKLGGNWYISYKLMLRGPRTNIPITLPKSLIDHSALLKGIQTSETVLK
jgi:hypothetical protein